MLCLYVWILNKFLAIITQSTMGGKLPSRTIDSVSNNHPHNTESTTAHKIRGEKQHQPRKRDFSDVSDKNMKITVKGKRPFLVAREAMHQVANMEKILGSTREKLSEREQELDSCKKRSTERENLLILANKKARSAVLGSLGDTRGHKNILGPKGRKIVIEKIRLPRFFDIFFRNFRKQKVIFRKY